MKTAGPHTPFIGQTQIKRGGAHGKPTVSDDLVVDLAEWATDEKVEHAEGVVVREPEDLVPLNVAIASARRYAQRFLGVDDELMNSFAVDTVAGLVAEKGGSLWDALSEAFEDHFETGIGKVGFAKELIGYLDESEASGGSRPTGVPALDDNFGALIERLADALALARQNESDARRDNRLERIVDSFRADYPTGCTRDVASTTLRRIDAAVDDTVAGDVVHSGTMRMRRDFRLFGIKGVARV